MLIHDFCDHPTGKPPEIEIVPVIVGIKTVWLSNAPDGIRNILCSSSQRSLSIVSVTSWPESLADGSPFLLTSLTIFCVLSISDIFGRIMFVDQHIASWRIKLYLRRSVGAALGHRLWLDGECRFDTICSNFRHSKHSGDLRHNHHCLNRISLCAPRTEILTAASIRSPQARIRKIDPKLERRQYTFLYKADFFIALPMDDESVPNGTPDQPNKYQPCRCIDAEEHTLKTGVAYR